MGEFGGGCLADGDTAFSEYILDIFVTEIESIVQPGCVTYDIWRESVTLIGIHGAILAISPS